MKIVPLYDKAGYYGYFFAGMSEYKNYASKIDWNFSHAFVVLNFHEVLKITAAGQSKISYNMLSSYLNPPVPFWIKNDFDYSCAIQNRFMDILPKTAEVIPTMNCCFRCIQCSYRMPKENLEIWNDRAPQLSGKYNMTIDNIKIVIDRLIEAKIENIIFTGGGEPLYHSHVTLAGMKYAVEKGLNVGLYTNGFFLNEQIIEELQKIDPLFIRVSIYGMHPDTFQQYVNIDKNHYYTIINNVRLLLSAKNKGMLHSKIILSFLVHPVLYPDVSCIDHFFEDHFSIQELKSFSYIRFTPAVDYFYGRQHDKSFFDNFFGKVMENAERLKNYVPLIIYSHRINDLYIKNAFSKCLGSGFYTEIAPNGDVYLCCERLMDEDYLIGNIITDSVEDIFKSDKRAELLHKINSSHCEMCPPLCKPHEINKQLEHLAELNIPQLQQWRSDLLKLSRQSGIFSGNMNDFES